MVTGVTSRLFSGLAAFAGFLATLVQSAESKKKHHKKKKGKKHKHKNGGNSGSGGGSDTTTPPRVRRNLLTYTLDEARAYGATLNAAYHAGIIDEFARRHIQNMQFWHNSLLFEIIHFAFIWEFESRIRDAIDPNFTLAYVPWEDVSNTHYIWTNDYLGPAGDPANGYRVLSGPTADWHPFLYNPTYDRWDDDPTQGLVREMGVRGSYPTADQMNAVMQVGYYPDYVTIIEGWKDGWARYHNDLHLLMGDGTAVQAQSPKDAPHFYCIHAWLTKWMKERAERHGYNPDGVNPNTELPGMPGWTVGMVFAMLRDNIQFA